ncbi:MAG: PIN domain-containing protein [Candidatus Diapherotrites archaeon]
MTGSDLFLDSSVWLGYFLGNIQKTKEIIESEENTLFTSIISLQEICRKLKKLGKTEKEITAAIGFIEENSSIINLNKKIVIRAADFCEKYGLHAMDSLIYASAMSTNAAFVTVDKDFMGCPKTIILERPGAEV